MASRCCSSSEVWRVRPTWNSGLAFEHQWQVGAADHHAVERCRDAGSRNRRLGSADHCQCIALADQGAECLPGHAGCRSAVRVASCSSAGSALGLLGLRLTGGSMDSWRSTLTTPRTPIWMRHLLEAQGLAGLVDHDRDADLGRRAAQRAGRGGRMQQHRCAERPGQRFEDRIVDVGADLRQVVAMNGRGMQVDARGPRGSRPRS